MRAATLSARPGQLKCRCGIASMVVGYDEARGEQHAEREREADADHAGRPSQAIEDLAEQRAAGEATQEIAREVKAACRAAIDSCRTADKAGGCRLGEECPNRDQRQADEQRRKIR